MTFALLATAALFIPAAAAGQVPAVAPPYHPAIDVGPLREAFARTSALNDVAFGRERFDANFRFAAQDRQMAAWREAHNPRRVRRAELAANLINTGNCDGAMALARRDDDDRLATRIGLVCASVTVSGPAAFAAGH